MITKANAIVIARELNLPNIVRRLVRGETLENDLDIFFGNAEEFFTLPIEVQLEYGQGTVVPLWDDGNFDRLVGVHLPTRSFVDFSIEEPFTSESVESWNYQQILLPYMRRILDNDQTPEFNPHHIAALFEFKFLNELIELESKYASNYEDCEKVIEDFRSNLT